MKYDELICMPFFCSGENKAEREEEKGKDEQEKVAGGGKSEKKKNSYK